MEAHGAGYDDTGFDQIIERSKEQAASRAARERPAETAPIPNEALCAAHMEETTAGSRLFDRLRRGGRPKGCHTLSLKHDPVAVVVVKEGTPDVRTAAMANRA